MSFPLCGNEKTRRAVQAFISADRLPHALLITGDTGLGKHTLAAYIAACAVCSGTERPCGICRDCRAAAAGSHPDIIYVQKEKDRKEIGVKIIRSVRTDAFIKPHEADKKVFIIEEAHRMNAAAQNALLKVLEEPPQNVVFILLCTAPALLLSTVRSRCITLSLSPVEGAEGAAAVSRISGCDGQTAAAALESARGNIGKAVLLTGKGNENPARDAAQQFITALLARDEYGMLCALAPFEKDRAGTDALFEEMRAFIWESIKTLPKNGKRAKILFNLYGDLTEYAENVKLNANLPLLFCALTARASEYTR